MSDIVIYTRQFCGYCARAKQLLDAKGVSYEEKDASNSPELRREMTARSNGGSTFPQIFIDGRHVGGCDDLHELDRRGDLDTLLAA
ncbi:MULTISPECIES: glutaredoxin 3 [unclassified Aureimonas]|uniref:glutaredoxin 3 n=1 Tax=unclassified Aureimonas TaxID=2615206 RepID=UPI0006F36164|nr:MULTISPECIES: glutaredoxin 3 [unclassified Aureimonas]KQT54004.1 glutaredoxin [Aureimonas sp. Leaf427]KQT71556.1 glutaredoxin [Aureimonas sp. Leaf460]